MKNDEELNSLDVDEQEEFSCYNNDCEDDNDNDDEEDEENEEDEVDEADEADEEESGGDGLHKESISHTETPEMHKSMPPPTRICDSDSERLCRTFVSCIEEALQEDVKEALESHEMRAFAGNNYRVSKNLPPDTNLDS